MNSYYTGKRAQHYNNRWRTYTRRTLAEVLAIIDFAALRSWAAFAWLLQPREGSRVHAFTLAEAQSLCQQAGLHLACGRSFTVDWLWHGWVLYAYGIASIPG